MKITRALLGCLLFTATLFAGPNFSGDWKLNTSKSDFGPMPAPDKLTMKIDHKDPALKVESMQVGQQGEVKGESNYTTDGKESKNKFRNNEMVSKVKWDGEALTFDSKLDFQGNEVLLKDNWTVSADGKTLTIKRKFSAPQGDFESIQVLEKQ